MDKIKNFLFKNTSTKQTVAKNTIWLFLGEIGSRLLKLVVFIYAARAIGVFQWGVFSYVLALTAVVGTFADVGINTVLTREVSKDPEKEASYIATSFILKLALSIAGSVVVAILLLFTKNSSAIYALLPVAVIMFFLDSMQEFGFAINRAFEKMEVEAISKIVSNAILVVVILLLLKHSHTALTIAYGYIAADIIATIIIFSGIRFHLTNLIQRFKKNLVWNIFVDAWPIAVISVFGVVLGNVDTIILGWFKNLQEVGLYAAAQKPIQLLILIPGLISTAILPLFSRLSFQKSDKLKTALSQSITLAIAISLPIVLGGIILGTNIMTLLFGAAYIQAGLLFKIMIVTLLVSASGVIISNGLFAENQQKRILQSIAIGAISNIVLCVILIPHYGMYGAAVATTLSQVANNAFFIVYAKKIPALRYTLKSGKIIIASAIMALAILFLKPFIPLLLLIVVAAIVYLVTLFFLQEQTIRNVYTAIKS